MMSFEDSQGEGSPQLLRLDRGIIHSHFQPTKQGSQNNTGSFVDMGENANDSIMEFPDDNNTIFCSEQKMIEFNTSHHFNNSKCEEEESDLLKKVLL